MTGTEKAAVVLSALDSDTAALVLKNLSEHEAEMLTLAIAALKPVQSAKVESLLKEFHNLCTAAVSVAEGGFDKARSLLEKAYGKDKAARIVEKLSAGLTVPPMDVARRADPERLAGCLASERAQLIAVVLAHLPPDQAARVLENLSKEKQPEVVFRLATLKRFDPSVLAGLEAYLERRTFSISGEVVSGGAETAAKVLSRVGHGIERAVLDYMSAKDAVLADEVRRNMFVFDDLTRIDDRDLQKVLRHVDVYKDLPMALKGVTPDVREKFFRAMSDDAAEIVKDVLDTLGTVPRLKVEEARQRIVDVARKLEAEGKVVLLEKGDEYVA